MSSNLLDWLHGLADSILQWLQTVRESRHPGYYRYSKDGALFKPSTQTGLGMSCLALRTCYVIGALSRIPDVELEAWIKYIQSFQQNRGRLAGYFEDRELLRILDKEAGWFRRNIAVRRAETRQACGTLLSVGAVPRYPVIADLPQTPGRVIKYMQSFPWDTNPWHAGSHTSHLIFTLKLNADHFGYQDKLEELLPVILAQLDGLQDKKSGSWFAGAPPLHQIVNAAMKIITGYDIIRQPFAYPEHLIDTCLQAANDDDACGNVDVTYVLYQCNKLTPYRQSEIRAFAEKRLQTIAAFQRSDGAFSFLPDRAGSHYYGVKVSRGLVESDVHGTSLFSWTIVMLAELLELNHELGWNVPVI